MTSTSGQAPESVDFPMPDVSGGPTRAAESNWAGWRIADVRANQLQEECSRLKDDIRGIDTERAALVERVRSFEDHNRLVTMISTGLIALAGFVGGIVIYLATSNPDNQGLTAPIAGLALLLLIAGVGVQWLPVRWRRESPEP